MNNNPASNRPTPPSQTPPPSGRSLAILAAVYLLTWWFVITGAISHDLAIYQLGLVALVGEGIYCFGKGRTFGTLKQWWQARSTGAKVGVGCLTLLFIGVPLLILPFWPIASLVTGFRQYFGAAPTGPRQQLNTTFQRLQPNSGSFSGKVAATVVVGVLLLCSATGVVMSHPNDGLSGESVPTQTAVQQSGSGSTTQPVAAESTSAPTSTPIPAPTATPKPKPTNTSVPPPPTNTPAPSCNFGGAPQNPWCYTFNNTGKLIYNPPGDFCSYFNCIPSFWNQTNGYVDECNDGTYSHSGGRQGACSYHHGEMRPLYQP